MRCVSFHLPGHWGKPLLHVVLARKVSPPTCWDSIQNLGWALGNVTVSICGSKTSFSNMCLFVFLMWPPSVVILCFSITCCSCSNVPKRCESRVSKQCFVLQTCLHTTHARHHWNAFYVFWVIWICMCFCYYYESFAAFMCPFVSFEEGLRVLGSFLFCFRS